MTRGRALETTRIPANTRVLSLVIDREICRIPPADAVAAACEHGVDWVQIRERSLDDRSLTSFCREISRAVRDGSARRGARSLVIVNRRVDLALATAAAGVHLGTGALAPGEVRALWTLCGSNPATEPLVGVSVHATSACAEAREAGADYLHLAPVFDPRSKPATRTPLGIEALREASRERIPVLAQGGVDAARCSEIIAAGAAGVAVTGEILLHDDPGKAAAALRSALDSARA